jgi:hypothetical protein
MLEHGFPFSAKTAFLLFMLAAALMGAEAPAGEIGLSVCAINP